MSWFTDLAGRAEELLNKVDHSAAVVLKKEDESPSIVTGRSRSYAPSQTPRLLASSQQQRSSSSSPPKSTPAATSLSTKPSAPSKQRSRKQIEEEKLFEFLNSSEGAGSTRNSTTRMTTNTTNIANSMSSDLSVPNMEVANANPVILNPALFQDANKHQDDQYAVMSGALTLPPMQPENQIDFPLAYVATVSDDVPNTIKDHNDVVVKAQADQSTSKVGSLELENRLLHNEIGSLNQELKQSLQRMQNVEAELRIVQARLDSSTAHGENEAKIVREYRERESDLRTALEAKDSQLAVLRVRLDEADLELAGNREALQKLEADNRRILEEYTNSSGLHGQTIQAAQDRLQQTEELLERERNHFRSVQVEGTQRITRLEEEIVTLSSNYVETKSSLEEERARNGELMSQLRNANQGLENVQQELTDYKSKAQWILQSKERLIATLKENAGGGSLNEGADSSGKAAAAAFVQLEELRQERDLLKEELLESGRQLEQAHAEMRRVVSQLQSELDSSREYSREIDERVKEERKRHEEGEQEVAHLKDEVRYLREDATRQKATLQSRLSDRDAEIERLRKQLVIRQVNGGGARSRTPEDGVGIVELETKLNALTENLIHKQTMLEALSTEKNSLVFQLERTEQQLKEQSLHSRRNASMAVSVNDDSDGKHRVAGFMAETPFDGQVARRVKRVYNTIDTFSFRLGVFMRRYPMARVLIIMYMVLLHFWVIVVLLTYSPEIHDKDCLVPNGKR